MALTSISVILTVCILKLHHGSPQQKEVPRWLHNFIFNGLNRLVHCRCTRVKRKRSRRQDRGKYTSKLLSENTEACLRLVNEPSKRAHSPVAEFRHHGHNNAFTEQIHMNDLNHSNSNNSTDTGTIHQDIKRLSVMEEILHYLKLIVARRDFDDDEHDVMSEWQAVAAVCDRFLFWLFLTKTIVITLLLMVIIPSLRYSFYDENVDDAELLY